MNRHPFHSAIVVRMSPNTIRALEQVEHAIEPSSRVDAIRQSIQFTAAVLAAANSKPGARLQIMHEDGEIETVVLPWPSRAKRSDEGPARPNRIGLASGAGRSGRAISKRGGRK